MGRRAEALELAVLGLLHDAPMHGYELRKRVNALLGWGRAFSYGTLYPTLKDMVRRNYLAEDEAVTDVTSQAAPPRGGRRGKVVYKLTPEGKERFADLLSETGPSAWDDEHFGVHFAFFGRADADTRMRILLGRRSRLQERLDHFRSSLSRTRERLDAYTLELQRHGLESVEREVNWLDDLINAERRSIESATTAHSRGEPPRTEAGTQPAAATDDEGE
ncbi:DNA-binding PadR family transcriptional regulator [Haloactinopolyspora alba]|uniref:DNA-binding PadR family transcriptional regulator n=1 Tax=Haloactinopolyspora alba TaxID=648780 RepID=A0A2P8DVU6_9ACTN|nr:PadR family transcriptional regulator [Haloactinopolyspora alba]PSL01342.1 DNA-binding PadR family transcriptional regulator [Haloactinopolyspora alba]